MQELSSDTYYFQQPFSYGEINELLSKGYAVDGRSGGLVLGRSHDDGGVFFLTDVGTEYHLMGELEGYEYIFSVAAQTILGNSFDQINNWERDADEPFEEFNIPESIRVINTVPDNHAPMLSKLILFEGLFGIPHIVNKHSTKRNLQNIDSFNQKYTYKYDSDDYFTRKKIMIYNSADNLLFDERPIKWK
ncbi:MAG: hypothetical protein ABWZ25_08920 [Chitinophagaceae bacterium]